MEELEHIMPANADRAVYAMYGDLAYAQSIFYFYWWFLETFHRL